ncbi:trypsin-like peptidase domain-containing protein [Streptomyces sp. CSDS2]|uniref:nSTAND1 domain-containing NTPase n=1 Tax=Streptomyces sp. CSDS2 TaxID=3055051 RepID=UPI0025AF04BA|nr:trypsin-like peptidase domain-containing protein [Streptomyces sp. CSDS2]MDN3260439.1 trypsin-like peptidase domain-containing protein [Streptomyces sp. CSDS2]
MAITSTVPTGPGEGKSGSLPGAVVQIITDDEKVAGAGFLAGDDLVITCAHVVRAAGEGPGASVRLAFPHAPGAPRMRGVVLHQGWRAPEAEDVAVIRLSGTPPRTGSLALGTAVGCRGHRVSSYGYPAQAPPTGHFGYGTAGDVLPDGGGSGALLQLTEANDLTTGFSGGPVVDEVTGLVIGMVTAISVPDGHLRGAGIAYATPAEVLREIWPELTEQQVRPYRGLEPFTGEHVAWFHGREAAVERVLSVVGERRLVLLLGPSGAGKSSLIQAGVLPALAVGGVPGSDRWVQVVARPGQNLAAELERSGLAGAVTDGIKRAVERRLAAEPVGRRLVLVIDQFEELLTPPAVAEPPPGGRLAAVQQLTELIGSSGALTVILVMRDDFYPRLAALAPALLNAAAPGLINIPATLGTSDLFAIIARPAQTVGARLEPGLPDRIIADVLAAAPAGAAERNAPVILLPPLELVLSQLWERRRDGLLTHQAYQRIGGITGALATWCNTVMDQLPAEQRPAARRILTALVRPADDSRAIPAARQQVSLSALRALAADTVPGGASGARTVDDVLAALTRHRIITTRTTAAPGQAGEAAGEPGESVAELIHDALIRDWAELRDWVTEDHRFQDWLRRAGEAHARWTGSTHPGDLLDGTDLAEGVAWSKRRGLPGDITEFLDASRKRQQAAARRTRRVNAVLACLLMVAVVAAALAFQQRQTAVGAQRAAESRQLAAQSAQLRAIDPDLASLLAVQAYRTSPTSEAAASLWAVAASPLRRTLTGLTDRATSVAFSHSPDGKPETVAAGGSDGTVLLWEAETGRRLKALKGHTDQVWSLAFSPDGETLATADADGTVRLWDTATARHVTTLEFDGGVSALAWSPDGKTLAVGADQVQLWDIEKGRPKLALSGTDDTSTSALAWSPDGEMLAASVRWVHTADGVVRIGPDQVRLWDAGTGDERARLDEVGARYRKVPSLVFSPDGETLAVSDDGDILLWNLAEGRADVSVTGFTGMAISLAYSPDGSTLAASASDHTVRTWRVDSPSANGRISDNLQLWSGQGVTAVAFSRDGDTVAAASEDGSVRLLGTGPIPHTYLEDPGMQSGVSAMLLSPDGRYLATDGSIRADGVRLWDMRAKKIRMSLKPDDSSHVMAFSSDSRTLAVAGTYGRGVRLWDVETGNERNAVPAFEGSESALAFSPDGRTLAIATFSEIHLWDAEAAAIRGTWSARTEAVAAMAYSPDGKTLATVGRDGVARLMDAKTGKVRATLAYPSPRPGPAGEPEALAFSPDGRTLATGGHDGAVRLWNVDNGAMISVLSGHTQRVYGVAFSRNGGLLASGDGEGMVRVWDTATRSTVETIRADNSLVAFGSVNGNLVTGGLDRTVRLWDVAPPEPDDAITQICRAVARDLTPQERSVYLPEESSGRVCPSR